MPEIFDNLRAVRLRSLNACGEQVGTASGFFLTIDQQTYLYTAWHVATGADWLNLSDNQVPNPPDPGQQRHYLAADVPAVEVQPPGVGKVVAQSTSAGATTFVETTIVGGRKEFKFELFDSKSAAARWQQDQQSRSEHPIAQLGGGIPKFHDVVRLPVVLPSEYREALSVRLPDAHAFRGFPSIGDRLTIFGFPFGFSSGPENRIEAIGLTRFVVGSWSARSPGIQLVEPAAYPVMSGAPVYWETPGRSRLLVGVYGGAIFPDQISTGDSLDASSKSNLPRPTLGVVYSLRWFHAVGLKLGM